MDSPVGRALAWLAKSGSKRLELFEGGPAAVQELAASPLAKGIEDLKLDLVGVNDAGVEALAASPHLGNVRKLSLAFNKVTAAGVKAFSSPSAFPALEDLDLSNNSFGDAGFQAFAAAPLLARLRRLRVGGHFLKSGAGSVAALAASTTLRNLRELALDSELFLEEDDVLPLAVTPILDTLEVLHVTDVRAGDRFATALAENPRLTRLRTLRLHGTQVSDPGAIALSKSKSLAGLTTVGLTRTRAIPEDQWTDWNGSPVGSGYDQRAWEFVTGLFPNAKVD